ncbi:MAG: hypothetical protein AAFW46_05080 [Pseudomonadota bacterium]
MPDAAFTRHQAPSPTAYHRRLANLLSRRFEGLWAFFASEKVAEEATSQLGVEIRRRAYKLDPTDHASLYDAAREIAEAMEISVPVSLYQGEAAGRARNAALFFDPAEAHVVLAGDLLRALTSAELRFTLGHELAHHKLWTLDEGRLWTANRLLQWATSQPTCAPAYSASARLERLNTELYADRYGLWAVGDLDPALRAQVKIASGQDDVSGAAYLAQAEAALEEDPGPDGHGEGHLRAALLAAWAHDPGIAEARAQSLIEGAPPLEQLDLLAQEALSDLTHAVLVEFLSDPWRGRDRLREHAARISPQLSEAIDRGVRPSDPVDGLRAQIKSASPTVKEYLAYLILDFATVDPELDEMIMAQALMFSSDFGFHTEFREVVARELKITRTKLGEIEKNAEAILARAESLLADLDGGAFTPITDPEAHDGARRVLDRLERRNEAEIGAEGGPPFPPPRTAAGGAR